MRVYLFLTFIIFLATSSNEEVLDDFQKLVKDLKKEAESTIDKDDLMQKLQKLIEGESKADKPAAPEATETKDEKPAAATTEKKEEIAKTNEEKAAVENKEVKAVETKAVAAVEVPVTSSGSYTSWFTFLIFIALSGAGVKYCMNKNYSVLKENAKFDHPYRNINERQTLIRRNQHQYGYYQKDDYCAA